MIFLPCIVCTLYVLYDTVYVYRPYHYLFYYCAAIIVQKQPLPLPLPQPQVFVSAVLLCYVCCTVIMMHCVTGPVPVFLIMTIKFNLI